ncbi:MAG: hypothetical protein JHD02_00895 [Thermoleophilaceae bacterium]|nr:hypothetical protein [Thermoleophilaceae bacterium]
MGILEYVGSASRGHNSLRALLLFAIALLLAVASAAPASAACAQAAPSVNSSTGKTEINLGNCVGSDQAWAVEYDSSVSQATFYPDLNANYWVTSVPSLKGQGAHWELRGSMPDARFASFQSYSLTGETMDGVFDEDFPVDAGSTNWISASGQYPGASAVRYTVPVVQTYGQPEASSSLNIDGEVLESSLGGVATLAYRVYPNRQPNGSAPTGGLAAQRWTARGQVDLPELVYVIDNPSLATFSGSDEIVDARRAASIVPAILSGVEAVADALSPVLAAYPEATDKLWNDPVNWEANEGLSTNLKKMISPTRAPLAALLWQSAVGRLPNFTAFPNDATRYYVGGVSPGLGQVLVTRFKAPTTPEPDAGDAMLATGESDKQLRYWSACLNNTLTLYVTGCLKDSQVKLDPSGYATLVSTSTSAAPKGMNGAPAANWLRHGSPNELLLIRQTLASPSFTQSINFYDGPADDADALRQHSGAFAPVSTYCSLNNFRYNDCRWKFSTYQEWLYALVGSSSFSRIHPR